MVAGQPALPRLAQGLPQLPAVDSVYAYQTSFGLASGQVLHRSQGNLLPSSVNPRYRIRGTNM
jgi:hypothetical protein